MKFAILRMVVLWRKDSATTWIKDKKEEKRVTLFGVWSRRQQTALRYNLMAPTWLGSLGRSTTVEEEERGTREEIMINDRAEKWTSGIHRWQDNCHQLRCKCEGGGLEMREEIKIWKTFLQQNWQSCCGYHRQQQRQQVKWSGYRVLLLWMLEWVELRYMQNLLNCGIILELKFVLR